LVNGAKMLPLEPQKVPAKYIVSAGETATPGVDSPAYDGVTSCIDIVTNMACAALYFLNIRLGSSNSLPLLIKRYFRSILRRRGSLG